MTYGAPPTFTSEQRKSIPYPDKFKCRVCTKLKAPTCFSKRELNTYTYKVAAKIPVTIFTAKLRCSECAGNVPQELQCAGPCGIWKSIDDFSKTARANGRSGFCKVCIAWKENLEPDVVTAPAPNGDLAPDEDDQYNATVVGDDDGADAGVWSDPELGNDDSDYGDDAPASSSVCWKSNWTAQPAARAAASLINVPYKPMAELKLSGGEDSAVASSKVPSSMAANAPSSDGFVATSAHAKAYPSPTNPAQQQGSFSANFDVKSQSSMSNPYESSEGRSQGWAAVDIRRRTLAGPGGITFNAWDPSGKPHTQHRYPSSSEPTSSRSSATATAAPAQSARTTKWAKPVGSRFPRPEPSAPAPPTQGHRPARPADDSDDEM